jgi:AcrR family transcriptional regulator
MTDPRIERTRQHVLSVVRNVLQRPTDVPLTFTLFASEAQVSRRTLYTHWGTIDRLIADAVSGVVDKDEMRMTGLRPEERLLFFLTLTRDRMAMPITRVAFTMLMSRGVHDDDAGFALKAIHERGTEAFEQRVGPITPFQYEQIIGPIFYAEYLAGETLTDDQLRDHAEYARTVLAPGAARG